MSTKKCSFSGCPNNMLSKNLCSTHYLQQKLGRTLKPVWTCMHDGCTAKVGRRGFCTPHLRLRVPQRICSFSGCGKPYHANGFCSSHATQIAHGRPLKPFAARPPRFTSIEERLEFYSSPEPMSGCLLWTHSVTTAGYGVIIIKGKRVYAHRAALKLSTGIEPKGMHALHSCDNPPCVNPEHLRWGTNADNIRDRYKRGPSQFRKRYSPPKVQSRPGAGAQLQILFKLSKAEDAQTLPDSGSGLQPASNLSSAIED